MEHLSKRRNWMRKGNSEDEKKGGGMTVREAGRKGGEVTSERHGPRFYEEIGRKGGQKVKKLIEQGKRAS
jgi:general stress protein YciG